MADPIIHLLHACEAGDLEAVKEMIERERVDVNATFYFDLHTHLELLDATPLLVTAGQGSLTICEYLIRNGANVLPYLHKIEIEADKRRRLQIHTSSLGHQELLIPKNEIS